MMTPAVHSPLPRIRRAAPALVGVVLFGCVAALSAWLMERPLDRGHGRDYQRRPEIRDAGAPAPAAVGLPATVTPGAWGDSVGVAAFAVHLADANTPAGAILWLHQAGAVVPTGTYEPVPGGATGAYWVLGGAYQDSVEAAGLLSRLRSRGQLRATGGSVVRTPLAYMIERDVAADSAAARVAAYAARGLPVYALRQADGRARLYAGAFAAASDTTLLADALRRAGVRATLAYRTGRSF